jgi:hypothetical protein
MSITTYPAIVRNGRVELMSPLEAPEGSEVYVVVANTVTRQFAQRKANSWLVSNVGNMLMADGGALIQSVSGWVWRFDVLITSASHQPWGPIGTLEIDADTGNVLDAEKTTELLTQRGVAFRGAV